MDFSEKETPIKTKSLFDPEKFKLKDNQQLEVEKQLTHVPVRKPNKQSFIRVNSDKDFFLDVGLIRLKEQNENYLVLPELMGELLEEIERIRLFTCIDKNGMVFLWPIKLHDEMGKLDTWNESAHEGAKLGMENWVRVTSNRSLGCYEIFRPKGDLGDPVWPNKTFSEILELGFKDYLIDSLSHPVVKQLRGIA